MNLMGYNNQVNQLTGHEEVVSEMIEIPYTHQMEEIHRDLQVTLQYYTTIWGRLTNHESRPLPGECVKLVKIDTYDGKDQLEVVDVATTDEQGCYELTMKGTDIEQYSIIVHKQALAQETVEKQIKQNNRPQSVRTGQKGQGKSSYQEDKLVTKQPSYYEQREIPIQQNSQTSQVPLFRASHQCERFYGEFRRGAKGNLTMYKR